MTTIERNYRKNPHTANFLMTFHAAAQGLPSDIEPQAEDLLDSIPVEAPAYRPTPNQIRFINDLTRDITTMDAGTGAEALAYSIGMGDNGKWTPENVSRWIDRLISKRDELRAAVAARRVQPGATVAATVADGRYAVEEGGEMKFFKVKNGRRPGFVFLDIQASDDWHAIRQINRIHAVLALIAADPNEASLRYGRELGVCGDCGRTLTDPVSRARGRGPHCDAKH
jgi:hypothetical protein